MKPTKLIILFFSVLFTVPGYGQKNKTSTDDVYFSWDDAKNNAKMNTATDKKPNTKNGAKEIIFIDRNENAQENSSRLLIAEANDSIIVDSDSVSNEEGSYLRDFNGSESDYEYAERIRRFHDPRFTIHISDPEYMDIYFLDDDQWNVYVGGSYAWITPTWTNPSWFDYYYRPFSYNSWYWRSSLYYPYSFYGYHSWAYSPWYYDPWYDPWFYYPSYYSPYYGYPYYGYNNWYGNHYYKSVDPSHNEAYSRKVANGSRSSNTTNSTRSGILSGVASGSSST